MDHIQGRVSIDQRPAYIDKRRQPGHWEADLMRFAKYGPALLMTHERHSQLLCVSRQPSKAAEPVVKKLTELFGPLPPCMRRTITFDNGTEFAYHHRLHKLSMRTFFCDAHAPWQKGGIENAIGPCVEACREKPTSLRSPMTACSVWFARIITLQESVLTSIPRPRFSPVTCCTSNVNPPPRVRGNDKSRRETF